MKASRELTARFAMATATCDPSQPHLAGISGGRDSMTLLHLLQRAGFTQLTLCHLDHGLPRESRGHAKFVKAEAARLGLRYRGGRADVPKLARETGESIETAGRRVRYAFFARCARLEGCATLFLGHHADDQVETFLFNLLRGSGSAGLGAMRGRTERVIAGTRLQIERPMLGIWRAEIDAYVQAHGLDFREDPTNAEPTQTRNRLRHTLIPELEKTFGRPVRSALWRAAEILGAEDEWLRELTAPAELSPKFRVANLAKLPLAQQRRLLHRWLAAHAIPAPGFPEVENVRAMLAPGGPAKINLPGSRHARRRAGELWIEGGIADC